MTSSATPSCRLTVNTRWRCCSTPAANILCGPGNSSRLSTCSSTASTIHRKTLAAWLGSSPGCAPKSISFRGIQANCPIVRPVRARGGISRGPVGEKCARICALFPRAGCLRGLRAVGAQRDTVGGLHDRSSSGPRAARASATRTRFRSRSSCARFWRLLFDN